MSSASDTSNAMREPAARRWVQGLADATGRLASVPPPVVAGRLTRMVGLTLEAAGCLAAVGDR